MPRFDARGRPIPIDLLKIEPGRPAMAGIRNVTAPSP